MNVRRSLLVLGQGDPRHPDTWSGIPVNLVGAFESSGVAVRAVDVESHGAAELTSKVLSFALDRKRWAARHHYGPFQFALRSKRARQAASAHSGPTLQFGAQFCGTPESYERLYCYCDANVHFGSRSPFPKRSNHLNASEHAAMVAREHLVYSRAQKIFVFSNALRESFISDFGLHPDKVVTVYAGVNLDAPSAEDLTRTVAPDAPPTVLFVGRDFERKGGEDLLKAFRITRQRVPNAKLLIAGCRPAMASTDGVEVLGGIPRTVDGRSALSTLYRSADVFCMPSRYEAFGIVFAEALTHGLPCVGTTECAMPEIIEDRKTGWLVPPGDVDRLADVLTTALLDRNATRQMGFAARDRATHLFSWQRVASTMCEHMYSETA